MCMHGGFSPDISNMDQVCMLCAHASCQTRRSFCTAFCFATFITPIILSYHIGRDAQVIFWIGDYTRRACQG